MKINGELIFLKLIGMEAKINTIYGYLEMAKTEKDCLGEILEYPTLIASQFQLKSGKKLVSPFLFH